jgi:ParB family transcriptional regulator, chromosome partitioning protein
MEATTTTKPRLGRGLDALLGETPAPASNRMTVDRISHNPWQPRKRFDDDELSQLSQSIKTHGILQPLVVRRNGEGYQLIAGERRLRAAQAAGLSEVPVHIVEFNDQQVYEAALVENIQRSDLNPIEKAQGFKDYLDRFGISPEQLGTKLGLDRTTIVNLLGLLNLPTDVQDAVRLGQISMAHAKVLKGVSGKDRQQALCKEIILKKLSVHTLEQMMKDQKAERAAKGDAKPATAAPEKTVHVESIEADLQQKLATRVSIKLKAKDKGSIVIDFETNDDFERILGVLQR